MGGKPGEPLKKNSEKKKSLKYFISISINSPCLFVYLHMAYKMLMEQVNIWSARTGTYSKDIELEIGKGDEIFNARNKWRQIWGSDEQRIVICGHRLMNNKFMTQKM